MPSPRPVERRQKLLHHLKKQPIEALLVSDETNVSYLTGFTGDSSFLLIGKEICTLISDGRYTTQIADECPELDVYIRPQTETIVVAAAKVVKKAKLQKLGVEADHLSLAQFEKLKEEVKGLEPLPLSGMVEELRQIKDAEEVAEIRLAIRQAEKGFEVLRAQLRGEMTELQAAHTPGTGDAAIWSDRRRVPADYCRRTTGCAAACPADNRSDFCGRFRAD